MEEEEKPRINLRRHTLPKASSRYLFRFALYSVALGVLIYLLIRKMNAM